MIKSPVVFLIFNRPDTTKKVFESIRQARPPVLLVIADGPRNNRIGEMEKCEMVRSITSGVDWNCEVLTNYSDVNLGCRNRISSGLDWVFSQVEEAIILEDDCLPHASFFSYCEELLSLYRYDERISSIGGLNSQFGRHSVPYSYYFSCYPHVWGWATWRRAWKHYDVDMQEWPKVRDGDLLKNILHTSKSVKYWSSIFQATYDKKIDTWDYQWIFNSFVQNTLNIIPSANLISNIGFGVNATHTVNPSSSSRYANMCLEDIQFPLKHPHSLVRNLSADKFTQNTYYNCDMSIQAKVLRYFRRLVK